MAVLDLVPRHEHALVEEGPLLPEPVPEADDASVLEQAEELDVVDVRVGVHVGPPQGHVGGVRQR